MPYRVERNPVLCKKNFGRPGCCWYLCDDRDEKICGRCFSCYNNCPHGVYEIIQGEPYPLNVSGAEFVWKCVQIGLLK